MRESESENREKGRKREIKRVSDTNTQVYKSKTNCSEYTIDFDSIKYGIFGIIFLAGLFLESGCC